MERKARAVWKGGLKDGKGEFSAQSGVFSHTPYSFKTRFEDAPGTNPEELIAAAHAACFSMALSAQLGEAGLTADKIETTATVTFDKTPSGALGSSGACLRISALVKPAVTSPVVALAVHQDGFR